MKKRSRNNKHKSKNDRPRPSSKLPHSNKKVALSEASFLDKNVLRHEENNNKNDFANIKEKFNITKEIKINIPANIRLENNWEQQKEGANTLFREKKFDLALFHYTRLIALNPNVEFLYGNRAACLMMMNKYDDALIDAKKSVEVNPKYSKGYIRIIKIAMALGNFTETESALAKWTHNDPINESIKVEQQKFSELLEYIKNADENFASENYAKALEYLNKVVDICIYCVHYKIKKCEYLTLLGQYNDAEILAKAVLEKDELNLDAKYILGVCLYHTDIDKALIYLEDILKLAPDYEKALELHKKTKSLIGKKSKGNEAFRQKKYEKAYTCYLEAIEIDPNNKEIMKKLYYNMAQASYIMKKIDRSIEECTKALKLDPNYVKVLMRRGQCYMDKKEFEEAIDDLMMACKLDPGNDCQILLEKARRLLREAETDYYAILGIDRNASAQTLKNAYYEKAMQYHPDRHSNASEEEKKKNERMFKNISRAYRVLQNRIPENTRNSDGSDDDDEMDESEMDPWILYLIMMRYFDHGCHCNTRGDNRRKTRSRGRGRRRY